MQVDQVLDMDAIDMINSLPDGSIDLVIADPPFLSQKGSKDRYNRGFSGDKDKYLEWCDIWMEGCSRKLKETGSMYTFGGIGIWYFYVILEKYMIYRNHIAWIKRNSMIAVPQLRNWFSKDELILYFTKTNKYIWNPIYKEYGIMGATTWQDIPVITKRMKESVCHPSQKPLTLLEKFVKASTNAGDLVLDPFCGSGSSLVAAKKLGRNYLGCDIVPEYTEIARRRLGGLPL